MGAEVSYKNEGGYLCLLISEDLVLCGLHVVPANSSQPRQ